MYSGAPSGDVLSAAAAETWLLSGTRLHTTPPATLDTDTKTSDRAFSAAAVKIWNDLPVSRLICLCFRLTDDYPYSGASDSMQHSFELRRR